MDLDALIRAQHRVLTSAQARDGGLTEEQVRWRVESRRWRRIARGLLQAGTEDLDWLGRAHAAVLWGGDGACLSLAAAAHLHGVEDRPPPVITVAIPHDRNVTRLPGTRYARRRRLEVVHRRQLPVTGAATTVLDLADQPGVTCAPPDAHPPDHPRPRARHRVAQPGPGPRLRHPMS